MPRPSRTVRFLDEFLSVNGDGTGDIEMVGDYSSSEGIFYVSPPSGYHYHINRLIVLVQDTGAFDAALYGNNITLTSGIVIEHVEADDTLIQRITPRPIYANADWGGYCYDVKEHAFGTGDRFLLARWTFGKAVPPGFDPHHVDWSLSGFPIIRIETGEKFRVRLNDDLSGLNKHRMNVQGISVADPA